jgi:hypothetical protein
VPAAAIPSLLVGRSEQCSKQSATVVLASLSRSAREVFRLVADAQLDPSGEQGEQNSNAALQPPGIQQRWLRCCVRRPSLRCVHRA